MIKSQKIMVKEQHFVTLIQTVLSFIQNEKLFCEDIKDNVKKDLIPPSMK